jgi:DNA-directed RNA polymerase subunit alpha
MRKIKTAPLTPNKFDIEKVSPTEINLRVSPFETGYGISVAHPLRRLLFSSSIGYAPVAVKIEGASHEFDNISGMLEDVSELIINLKSIRFKLRNDLEKAEIKYSFKGPKEITGSDLETDEVEVVTPNNFLASINEDGNLNMTLIIYRGIGYVPSEDIREDIPQEEGYIPLDAYFTPVRRANYKIENVLVDDNPNFEEIIFNIVTDGQVTPVEAFENSLKVLQSQLSIFSFNEDDKRVEKSESDKSGATVITASKSDKVDSSKAKAKKVEKSKPVVETLSREDEKNLALLFTEVKDFGLPLRIINSLSKAGYNYVGEVALLSDKQLEETKNLGKKSIEELKVALEKEGLSRNSVEKFSEAVVEQFKEKIKQ